MARFGRANKTTENILTTVVRSGSEFSGPLGPLSVAIIFDPDADLLH